MSDSNGPGGTRSKVDQLAEEAREAGHKFIDTDTGRKVADVADSAFTRAEALGRKALDSDTVQSALDSGLGRKASDFAEDLSTKTRSAIPNDLARSVAVGAAAGAVMAIPIPFVGSIFGAIVGGGLGYLRAVIKSR